MLLQQMMADKAELWNSLVEKHNLRHYPYDQIVSWKFGDMIFKTTFDNISSTIKARKHGFHDCIDSEEMYIEMLTELREQRYIP
ncbi:MULTISPECIES: hypothetical protein [Paraburkholderia]